MSAYGEHSRNHIGDTCEKCGNLIGKGHQRVCAGNAEMLKKQARTRALSATRSINKCATTTRRFKSGNRG
jgi:hypothetical protein